MSAEPTKADLEMRIHLLEQERNELVVSLSIAHCDVQALEAENVGLRTAVASLRRAEELYRKRAEP